MSDLWRYPVKSFQGQRDRRAFISPFGFLGDRRCVVIDNDDGQPLRAMKSPLLLAYRATFIDPDRGEEVAVVTPEGRHVRWNDTSLAHEIGAHLDLDVRLVRAPMGIHDILPIQIVTEASIAQVADWVGHDPDRRRFRPSVVIETDAGVPFVSAEAVSAGYVNFDKIRGFISEQDHLRYSEKYLPKRGDIFMVKSGATTGVTAIVETDLEFNIWSPLAVIRCGPCSDPYFVLNFMRSKNFLEAVALNWSFGTQQNIGMGVIENLAITVPPIDEQRLIAEFLVRDSSKLDALTAEANSAMKLLQERRTALISAAVTGKIDVREAA